MSEQIRTAAELDALPVGSVVVDRYGDATTHDQPGIWTYAETASMGTARLVRYAPFRVLYRPDAPVTAGATVTRADLAEAWERGLNTGIGYKTALDVLGPDAPKPENPYAVADGPSGDGA